MSTYSVAEFRANIRKALNEVDQGQEVYIVRHDVTYQLSSTGNAIRLTAPQKVKSSKKITKKSKPAKKNNDLATPVIPMAQEPIEGMKEAGVREVPECCTKKQPCRHWVYNDLDEEWVNTITGESRAAE